jgi:hypothetical protein
MPWVGTELWVADIAADGSSRPPRLVAGGDNESIFQPEWSPDGVLYFVSDRSGWWNLYRCDPNRDGGAAPLCPRAAEFGQAQWNFGNRPTPFCRRSSSSAPIPRTGADHLARLDIANAAS